MESAKVDITRTALSLSPLGAPCAAPAGLVRLPSSSATSWTPDWSAALSGPPAKSASTAVSAAPLHSIHATRIDCPSPYGARKLIILKGHRNSRNGAEL